jgi:hypothetical protein
MTDPKLYAHTYWSHKGKYPEIKDAIDKLIPDEGEIPNADRNPALETFRVASNCCYDLYNNGLCNRAEEFQEVFGFEGPYREYDPEEDDDDRRSYNENDEAWWTQENINRVEDAINRIILAAAKEQGIPLPEIDSLIGCRESDRIIEGLSTTGKPLSEKTIKPFVQLTGQDGNVFIIISRVSGALKKAGQPDKAKEFTDKAFSAGNYDEVLRLAMTYCDVA